MNTTAIAAALRALADAIDAPTANVNGAAAQAASLSAPAPAAPKPRGRPPKGVETFGAPAAATPAVAAAPTAAAAPATPATPASNLTHAIVTTDFKAAALAHGREFVKGLLTQHGASTFDQVKDLATFQVQLKAGPQVKPTGAADDLLG